MVTGSHEHEGVEHLLIRQAHGGSFKSLHGCLILRQVRSRL
ncbi:hypothetical protein [Rhizobium sp. 007]|nr:hypothetical protein [Rhizobium sp. 007]